MWDQLGANSQATARTWIARLIVKTRAWRRRFHFQWREHLEVELCFLLRLIPRAELVAKGVILLSRALDLEPLRRRLWHHLFWRRDFPHRPLELFEKTLFHWRLPMRHQRTWIRPLRRRWRCRFR